MMSTAPRQLSLEDQHISANDDMQNLLNSTDIATVFLDNDLNIKRFTEQAKELVPLRPTDIGRPIAELSWILKTDDLSADCRGVLKTLMFKEAEVETGDGGCYLMRIAPYRTSENVIDGVVLTFVDLRQVRDLRKSEEAATELALAYFQSIVETVREPLLVLDEDLRVVSANRSFYRVFQTAGRQTEGSLVYELGTGQWDLPKLRELLESILPRDSRFEDYEVEVEIPKLGKRTFMLNARQLKQPKGVGDLILLALESVSSQQVESDD